MPAAGVFLSLALFFTIRGWEESEVEKRAADLTREQVGKLDITILRSMEVLYSIASLHAAEGRIDRKHFSEFVGQALARQPELQALSWNPLVTAARRATVEAAATAEGLAGFQIREKDSAGSFPAARPRREYIPVYFIEPFNRNVAALGYDLGSDSDRLSSIEQARDTGRPIATAPIRLAQGPENEAGFLVLLPIYTGPVPARLEERRTQLAGFAVAVFRVNGLVDKIFRELQGKGIEARLFDESRSGELLYGGTARNPGSKTDAVIHLPVAGRRWAVVFQPTAAFIASESRAQSWLVLSGGLAFALLATAYLYGGWQQTNKIAVANAALQEEVMVRQRAESAAAVANRAKSDFLASMSHEIRTPLNAILGYTQLMQRDAHLPPEQRDMVGGISASGRHLLGLINEILDLSKIEAGRMEMDPVDFDLAALADGLTATFRPLCAQKRIGFRLELEGHKQTRVRGDEGKLRQVLINLAGNAVKFTSGGEVYVHFKPEPEGHWLFEVIDTGQGIPEEEHEDIFEPFHQGRSAHHQGGTGLGLAIARRQVELLGGRLQLQSERGLGSRFYFEIPLAPAQGEDEGPALQIVRLAADQQVRALVVDDRIENRDVLGGLLTAIGCEVCLATNSGDAIARTREVKPAIVFLDLFMPGVNGPETFRHLLADPACGRPKIVMHTASALPQHREDALAAGCVDFVSKPFRCERLYQCLKDHLGVEFLYAASTPEAETPPGLELSGFIMPEDICSRLMVAAELHSTTALKAGLQELRRLGPEANRLVDHIRQLMRSYDMDGIMHVLTDIVSAANTPSSHGLPRN